MVDFSDFQAAGLGGFLTNSKYTYSTVTYNGFTIPWASAAPTSAAAPSPSSVSTVTGVNPNETSYSLYGHPIPLSVFGVGRIGGEIVAGPWIANGKASFIISFGVPADPTGTRTLREIAFDSEVAWTASGGFASESFTYRFYGGSLTQAADALEIANFGSNAVAYRPQILIAFENLPLANTKFGKIPYVSAVIADSTGDDVNLGEAFTRLATSPWVGLTSSQFATSGITDGLVSGGLIFADDTDFLQAIQLFARFYPSWDILQTDKLRIIDRSSATSPDIVLDSTRLAGNVLVARQGHDTVPKDLVLSTIDPGADYTIVPFTASLPRDPVAVTSSVGSETAYLPAIMDASTRASVATFAKYHEELTRKTISGTAMAFGLEMEPGDLVQVSDLGDDFTDDIFRVVDTLHGVNYTVEFTAEPIMRCDSTSSRANWDSTTRQDITLTNGNLTATNNNVTNDAGVIGNVSHTSGKYYIEYTASGGTWGTGFGGTDTAVGISIQGSGISFYSDVGFNAHNAATVIAPLGFPWVNGTVFTAKAIGQILPGDIVGVAIDLDHSRIWFRRNNGNWLNDAVANPATNTNGLDISALFPSHPAFPVFVGSSTTSDECTANFGASAFTYAAPSGFGTWQ